MLLLHILAAAALVSLAAYAQYRIPFHTLKRRNVLLVRATLATVGVLLGIINAWLASEPAMELVAFAQGFGAAHFPAALILFLKRARHEGRS